MEKQTATATDSNWTVKPTESELKWLEKHHATQSRNITGEGIHDYVSLVHLTDNTTLLITLREKTRKYDCNLLVMSSATINETVRDKDTMMDAITSAMNKVAMRVNKLSNEWREAETFAMYGDNGRKTSKKGRGLWW